MKTIPKKDIKILKKYWKELNKIKLRFYYEVEDLEDRMRNNSRIHTKGLEFFWIDGEIVGIGNTDRTVKLLQQEDLK